MKVEKEEIATKDRTIDIVALIEENQKLRMQVRSLKARLKVFTLAQDIEKNKDSNVESVTKRRG